MNGIVYRSAGITLNWHTPADQQEARETQAIRFAWRCRSCGASGSGVSLKSASVCDACGATVQAKDIQQYLEPAGFSVDFYEEPHNDVSTQHFVPVERPWVSTRGTWSSFPNPRLGRFRSSAEGYVYHHSSGANGTGYALCLACGRAEPMLHDGGLPHVFEGHAEHKRLRSRKDDRVCPGSVNRWAIKERISLGHQVKTDVLEIQLRDREGHWLDERVAATTISVAIRDALAELIGIQASELVCDVKQGFGDDQQKCMSILVFDRYASGYASGAYRFVEQIFREARKRLDCVKKCDSACPSCVLDYDQRFDAESLNRHTALRVLTPEWLDALQLPSEMRLFGEGTRVEVATLAEAVLRESARRDATLVRLFATGSKDECSIADSPLRALAYRLAALSRPVEIVVARSAIGELDEADKYSLASLADHPSVSVRSLVNLPRVDGATLLAEVQYGAIATRWASADTGSANLSERWGESSFPAVSASQLRSLDVDGEQLDAASLRPQRVDVGDREIAIHHELDGSVQGFGKRFWGIVSAQHSRTKTLLDSAVHHVGALEYSDRYLFTPLSVALLLEIVVGLRERVGRDRWANPPCRVVTIGTRSAGDGRVFGTVFADWPDAKVRDRLTGAFDYAGIDASLHTADRRSIKHGRVLKVLFSDGNSLTIRLDQGVSYWRVPGVASGRKVDASFDLADRGPEELADQVRRVAELAIPVEGAQHPTEIFVKARSRY